MHLLSLFMVNNVVEWCFENKPLYSLITKTTISPWCLPFFFPGTSNLQTDIDFYPASFCMLDATKDKLSCFANAIRLLENLLVERVFTASPGKASSDSDSPGKASNWITLLAALILKANPPNLYSNLEFTTSFRQPERMTPEENGLFRLQDGDICHPHDTDVATLNLGTSTSLSLSLRYVAISRKQTKQKSHKNSPVICTSNASIFSFFDFHLMLRLFWGLLVGPGAQELVGPGGRLRAGRGQLLPAPHVLGTRRARRSLNGWVWEVKRVENKRNPPSFLFCQMWINVMWWTKMNKHDQNEGLVLREMKFFPWATTASNAFPSQ